MQIEKSVESITRTSGSQISFLESDSTMHEELLQLLLTGEPRSIDELRRIGSTSPKVAVDAATAFLRCSGLAGRHFYAGFRISILEVVFELLGHDAGERFILNEWPSFPDESREEFLYDLSGSLGLLSTPFATSLFFHQATSLKCKGHILIYLLQSMEQRHLNSSFFFRLLNDLSSQATAETRDAVDLFCIGMHEVICSRLPGGEVV